jgi:hypothetical protein
MCRIIVLGDVMETEVDVEGVMKLSSRNLFYQKKMAD